MRENMGRHLFFVDRRPSARITHIQDDHYRSPRVSTLHYLRTDLLVDISPGISIGFAMLPRSTRRLSISSGTLQIGSTYGPMTSPSILHVSKTTLLHSIPPTVGSLSANFTKRSTDSSSSSTARRARRRRSFARLSPKASPPLRSSGRGRCNSPKRMIHPAAFVTMVPATTMTSLILPTYVLRQRMKSFCPPSLRTFPSTLPMHHTIFQLIPWSGIWTSSFGFCVKNSCVCPFTCGYSSILTYPRRSPIRSSIVTINYDILTINQRRGGRKEKTKLEQVLAKGGGAYKTSGFDSVFFQIYADATFCPVKAERRSLTVGLSLAAPSGAPRDKDAKKRYAYWEHSKRLQSGSLVALIVVTNGTMQTYFGVISSFGKDIAESSKASKDNVQVQISFFDPEVELMALRRHKMKTSTSYAFLVDNSVMYEASRPFLERMKSIEPTEIPFSRYIAHNGPLRDVQLQSPRYALHPRFSFKLSCLAKSPAYARHIHDLNISRPGAVAAARRELLQYGRLDPSQVDAVLNTLVREISLCQGCVVGTVVLSVSY